MSFWPAPGNQWRTAVRHHLAKSCFETYKIYDHLQKFRLISQKFAKILRFEHFEITTFCRTLAYENFAPIFLLFLGKVGKFKTSKCTRLNVWENIWKEGPKWPLLAIDRVKGFSEMKLWWYTFLTVIKIFCEQAT